MAQRNPGPYCPASRSEALWGSSISNCSRSLPRLRGRAARRNWRISLQSWNEKGARSTTVDGELLERARRLSEDLNDADLSDESLGALVAAHRAGEKGVASAAYDGIAIEESHEWGNLKASRVRAAPT